MALIDRIINIDLQRVRDTTPAVGYGIPLFVGESLQTFPDVVRSYSSLEEVLVDYSSLMPEYAAAVVVFSQSPRPTHMLISQRLGAQTVLEAYEVAKLIDPGFYAVSIESAVESDILDMAAEIQADGSRIFGVSTDQPGVLSATSGNLFELLKALNYDRTYGIWSDQSTTQFPATAWSAKMMAKVPGSANWRYQNLLGVQGDSLLNSEELNVESYNASYYRFLATKDVTIGGKMFSGEWIDAIHGIDWMTTSLEVSLASLLVDVDKVPYTARGDGLIRNAITAVLQLAADNEVINNDFLITFTDINTVSLANKTARIRDGIEIFVTLTGAINEIKIKFVVSD